MKRLKYLIAVAMLAATFSASAQYIPTHDKYVTYITGDKGFLEYFPDWEPGRQLSEDENFFISRVKLQERFVNRNTQAQVYTDNDNQRRFSLNTPMGVSDTYWQTLPRYVFDGDVFSMWSYVDEQGGWSQSWIRNVGSYSDICHKNGVYNSGGVIFFDSWGGDNTTPSAIVNMLVTRENGKFKYLDKFIRFLRYYGIDGLSFNPEGTIPNASLFQDFLAEVHEKAADYGWHFSTNWYGANNNSGGIDLGAQLTSGKSNWFVKDGRVVNDIYFLNYGVKNPSSSLNLAEQLLPGSSNMIHVGFDIQGTWMGSSSWKGIKATKASIVFWGNHNTDMIYQNSTEQGSSDEAVQKCYQEKLEQVFSGGNRNPANTPAVVDGIAESGSSAMKKFHGVAALMPARSVLQTLPFVTRFSLGNGLRFRFEGKETFHNKWYGLSTQDYLPTWRWWVATADGSVPADAINCGFTFADSWWAGSCLSFSGQTKQSDVRLFKTNFDVSDTDVVNLVYKLNGGRESKARLFWSFVGSEGTLHFADIPSSQVAGEWSELKSTAKALGMTGKVALLGIRFENTSAAYEMLVGELGIVPAKSFNPVKPEVAKAEFLARTYNSLSYKLIWNCQPLQTKEDSSLPVYNEDCDTWYYEVYSQTKGKEPVLDGCTTSWAHYVVGAESDSEVGEYRIGVCAVAPDGKTRSEIAWSDYKSVGTTQIDGIKISKPIVKTDEEFRVEYKDPTHEAAAKWQILDPLSGQELISESSSKGITASLSRLGSYDVAVTGNDGKTINYRGFVQISGDETGALPVLNDFTAEKTTLAGSDNKTSVSFDIKRLGEGTVSRGLEIKDPYMFRIPAEALPRSQSRYSVCLWYKPSKFAHSKYGTNLINKRDISIHWPNNNWGAFWVHIWPETFYKGVKVMEDNAISYTMYNNEARRSFCGNDNKHEIPNLNCYTGDYGLNTDTWSHILISYDGSKQYIFFNGKKIAENRATFNDYNECPIYIGGSNVYHSGIFGTIDDVQVWWKALTTETEVKEAMAGYYGKDKPADLKGYWSMEDFSTEADSKSGKSVYMFANEVDANKGWKAEYISFNGAGGEDTSSATYVNEQPNNNVTGCPALPGTLPVTTKATLTARGMAASVDGNKSGVLTAVDSGTFDVTLTLSNAWGSDSKTKVDYIVATDIDGIENIEVYPVVFESGKAVVFAEAGNYEVQVYNAAGQKVAGERIQAMADEVRSLGIDGKAGVYVVRILKDGRCIRSVKMQVR